jgi:hypothetical protein
VTLGGRIAQVTAPLAVVPTAARAWERETV